MRFLQIEDDHATAQSIELMLKSEGHSVYTTDLGEEGLDLAKQNDYDLILLDLNLPDMSGFEVLQGIRDAGIRTPIIIQSGTSNPDAKVRALNSGADDFIKKPFRKDELLAYCNAVVRRHNGNVVSVVTTGNLSIDLNTKTVTVAGRRVYLTGREYQILEFLSLRKGTAITKEMFLDHLYGGKDEPELKIIDVFICKLRKKLATANGGLHHIDTVWGRGYTMNDPEPALPAE